MDDAPGFCWTCWIPPAGPSTPFQGSEILWDSFRVLALALCLSLFVMCMISMWRVDNPPQGARFLTLAMLTFVVASIQFEHFGDTANWRVLVTTAALVLGNVSVFQYLRRRRKWFMVRIPYPPREGDDDGR